MKRRNFTRREIHKFITDIDEARSKGMQVKDAFEAVGISQQSYYRHKAGTSRRPPRVHPETVQGPDYKAENERLKTLVVSLMRTMIDHGIFPDSVSGYQGPGSH
jgi:hypothetical protein